jgi:hypothetical protein
MRVSANKIQWDGDTKPMSFPHVRTGIEIRVLLASALIWNAKACFDFLIDALE